MILGRPTSGTSGSSRTTNTSRVLTTPTGTITTMSLESSQPARRRAVKTIIAALALAAVSSAGGQQVYSDYPVVTEQGRQVAAGSLSTLRSLADEGNYRSLGFESRGEVES